MEIDLNVPRSKVLQQILQICILLPSIVSKLHLALYPCPSEFGLVFALLGSLIFDSLVPLLGGYLFVLLA